MNRRGFIGTLTALAGVVLAEIKGTAAPDPLQTVTHPYWRRGVTTLAETPPITGLVETSGDLYIFTRNRIYKYTQGPGGTAHVELQEARIALSDVKRATFQIETNL